MIFEEIAEVFKLPPQNDEYIAIIGGLGYIGSHTSLELIKSGYNILIIDNLSNAYRGVFDRLKLLAKRSYKTKQRQAPEMHFHEADYRDEVIMRKLLDGYRKTPKLDLFQMNDIDQSSKIIGVIHFGGYKSVQESIRFPLKYYANNVAGVVDLCSLLDEYHIRTLIFSSSATVYGSIANLGVPLKEEYCTHQTETFIDHDGSTKTTFAGCTGLTNPYGRSKWMCEAILADLALADPRWTIIALRYFNPVGCDESGILGEDPRGIPTNLMPIVTRVVQGSLPVLDIFGIDYPTPDGTAVRDFIHVTDLAHGHVAALNAASQKQIQPGFSVYNLGSGQGSSVLDIVAAMESASMKKIPLTTVDRREGDVGICVAMPTKAEMELGWKAEKTIQMCCRDIVNFLAMSKKIDEETRQW
jgi:UDP-glucose 4-epimerase